MKLNTLSSPNNVIDQTLSLLKEGETKIKFSENKNLVLVLGNTGAGKSAFTQWISGDNSKLVSKEVNEGTGYFVIEDGNRIGNSEVFPGLVENSNAVFYDCPGFDDHKNTSKDMAKTYFIKKMADYSENLKIVFVVNHFSLREGADQDDFLKLIRHAVGLIKDVSNFKDSISIFASKVDNQYIKKDEKLELVPDSVIKKSIINFLEELKNKLVEKSKVSISSIMDKEFYKNAIQFIDSLLVKKEENYPKIGLFRRPDKPGKLVNIESLQKEKNDAKKIVYENLKFSKKNGTDFHYSLSENSKNEINSLAMQINENISTFTNDLSKKIHLFYQTLVKNIKEEINIKIDEEFDTFEAIDALRKIDDSFVVIPEMTKELNKLNSTKEFVESIQKIFKKLDINEPIETLAKIENQGKYLNFLKLISYKQFRISSKQFTNNLQQTIAYNFKSKEEIKSRSINLIENIKTEIKAEVEEIKNKMKKSFNKKLENDQFHELLKELNNLYEFAFSIKLNDQNLTKLKIFIRNVVNGFQELDTSILTNTVNIAKLGEKWKLLKMLSTNDETDVKSDLFIELWTLIFDTIKHYKNWVNFIDQVYGRLSEYEAQKDVIETVKNLGIENKSIDSNNFNQFSQKMIQLYGLKNDLNNLNPSDLELQLLNNVLDTALKSEVTVSCESNRLMIKGDYLKINGLNKTISECKKDNIQMFALNKIFFDDNLDQIGAKIKLMMISPQIELAGDKIINLNGKNPGFNNGSPSTPGLPGDNAGSFLAIGKQFIDINGHLTVTANGSSGQEGKSGSTGSTGYTPETGDTLHYSDSYWYHNYGCTSICKDGRTYDGRRSLNCYKHPTHKGNKYTVYGFYGGDGSDGGCGGLGGLKGSVKFIGFENNSTINILNSNGSNGKDGQGGLPGLDGGDSHIFCKAGYGWYFLLEKNYHARSGRKGQDGGNRNNLKPPKPAVEIDNQSIAALLKDYEPYLIENLGNRFKRNKLIQFHEFLKNNEDLKIYNTILTMVKELKTMEQKYFKLKKMNKNEIVSLYKSFLERVESFANNLKKDNFLMENKKVLSYLYAATLTKINNLENDDMESSLIIEVNDYLNLVNDDMAKLKDLKNEENKLSVIKNYKDDFKKQIDNKILEAKELIDKEVLPELDKINKEMESKLDTLVKEVLELEKKAEEDHHNLIKKKNELQKQMAMGVGFGVMKFVGAALTVLGPIGVVAGVAISGAAMISEGLALHNQNGLPQNFNQEDIKNLRNNLETLKNKKIDEIKKLVEVFLQDLADYKREHHNSKELKDVEEKILAIKEELKDADGTEINDLLKQIKKILLDKENELKSQVILIVKINKDAVIKVGQMLNKFKTITSVGIDVYNKYKDDKNKIAAINNAIRQNESIISGLKEYENEVYETIIPMLHGMQGDLKRVSESLKNKSQVALDVTKWKTQMVLRDMKLLMHQLTQGFKVEANIARCIEKQEEAMNTLVNIYDRINAFQDQQNLGNYLANICSASARSIKISDPDLANEVLELEIAIRSNIALKQYANAINTLKQWVFPFAQIYLEEQKLPDQFKLDNDLDNQINKVIEQVEKIGKKIAIYKTSVKKSDQYIYTGEFSSNYKSTDPFYVFKNEDHLDIISAILAGEEVLVNADILNSVQGKDAIKFNKIEVNFKAKNESLQAEIKEKLDLFKISATHLGNSYYRCDKKIYSVTSPAQRLLYSIEKKSDGTPVEKNNVYRKIAEGDLVLSPYAMWKIQLIKAKSSVKFNELEKYKNEIDLELVGYGSFISDKINVTSLKVDNYYMNDDTVISKKKDKDSESSLIGKFRYIISKWLGLINTGNNHQNNERTTLNLKSHSGQKFVDYRSNAFETSSARLDNDANQKTSLSIVDSPVDILGNLVLGQLIIGQLYGPNNHLSGNHYISPDLKRKIEMNELSKRILPIFEKKDEDF